MTESHMISVFYFTFMTTDIPNNVLPAPHGRITTPDLARK